MEKKLRILIDKLKDLSVIDGMYLLVSDVHKVINETYIDHREQ